MLEGEELIAHGVLPTTTLSPLSPHCPRVLCQHRSVTQPHVTACHSPAADVGFAGFSAVIPREGDGNQLASKPSWPEKLYSFG